MESTAIRTDAMTVTFWGVRGSTPTPGAKTYRYGGNTTCVSVEVEGKVLILDAGSGIRKLGHHLVHSGKEMFLLLTHVHADHILGFPFFEPLYEADSILHLLHYPLNGSSWSPVSMLNGIYYPMPPSALAATIHNVETGSMDYLQVHGFQVKRLPLNHPGGSFGYRIEDKGRSLVFMTDNEIDPPGEPTTTFESFVEFARGATVLCHDAQYLREDLPAKRGWGHSPVYRVCELAIEANVEQLVLFHHDPQRSDDDLDALQSHAQGFLKGHGIDCTVAYEGLTLEV